MNGLALAEHERMLLAGCLLCGEPLKGTSTRSSLVVYNQNQFAISLGWQIDCQLGSNVGHVIAYAEFQRNFAIVGLDIHRLNLQFTHIEKLKLRGKIEQIVFFLIINSQFPR